jgi:adhesin/invasin
LTNLAGPVNYIAFVQQPSNTAAGNPITPAVTVQLIDVDHNPISNKSVTVRLLDTGVPLGGTPTQITNASGIATFDDLKITKPGTYSLDAEPTDGVGPFTLSVPFNIAAGSAVSITALSGFGQTATVGSAYSSPLVALVEDAFMNPVQGAQLTFAAPGSGASVTFGGPATVTTDANGEATSPAMTANGQDGPFQVTASTTGAATSATFSLTNVAGAANKLAFIQQPTDTAAGANITPPVTVQLEDSSGNAVHTANVPITLQVYPVAAHMLAPLSFAAQNTDANGLATFSSLSISQVGQYQLLAESTGIASATSNPFNIHAGTASKILATAGTPQSAIIQTAYAEPLQATVTDTKGNPTSGVSVVFTAPTSGPSGLFGGQSTVTIPTDAQGHAAAVITANSIAGTFGVTASSTAITGSAIFDLTNLPAGSSSLAFVQQPSNTAAGQIIAPPVTVQVRDGSGNPVRVPGIPVVLSLSSGTGALSGTVVQLTDATGLATFNDLKIGAVGTKTLRAASPQQAPVDSKPFQITAGTATSIAVFSGSPQATTVSQQFPSLLQARVTDLAGNPVSGVSVTFALSTAAGPGGTFSGPTTVATDADGIATAPALTANSSPGNFAVTATAAVVGSPAVFSLTNLPQQSSAIVVTPTSLAFASEINQQAPPAQTVQISAGSSVTWTTSSSASWLSAMPANGTGNTQITVSVNPAGLSVGTYTGSISITGSSGGVTVVAVTYIITDKPALVISPPVLVFLTTSNTITPAAQMLHATSTSRTIGYFVSTKVSTPSGGTWLQISTTQGQTPGTVTVTANPENLSNGVYDGSVLFTPTDNTANSVTVPVTLIVGCGQGGCQLQPTILALVNGASFQPGGAPRAIETIFGTNLSDAVYLASSYPLPTQLGPTSVTVNGMAAPLFYASPTQINFQMPGSVPTSTIQVMVNNQATVSSRALRASQQDTPVLTVVHPGLFVTPDKRAAALNGDLSPHTAATPIPAGGYVILFLTGEGSVTPAVPDGTPAPANPLSIIDTPAQVNIGGASAQVTYQGLAPGYAGLAQINAIVPSGLTPGDQPVFITINGVPSNSGVITVK